MGWVRLSDDFYDHPKLMAVGPHAELLYIRGLAWSNRNLTDGHIPYTQGRRLADYAEDVEEGGKPQLWHHLVDRLVNTGLWTTCEDGWQIHDYHDYQRSADEIHNHRTVQHEQKVLAGKRRAAGASRDQQGRLQTSTSEPADPAQHPPPEPPDTPAVDQHPDQQDSQRSTSPNPNPIDTHVVLVSNDGDPQAVDDDGRKLAAKALNVLAHRDLERRIADKGPVGNRERWLDAVTKRRHADQGARALELAKANPGTAPEKLADLIDPPTPAANVTPIRTDFAPGSGHLADWSAR
jgi:hypothetical protein